MLKLQIIGGPGSGTQATSWRSNTPWWERSPPPGSRSLQLCPSNTESDIDVDTPDLGRVMLERILLDLRTGMRLLPETAERLRGVDESTQAGDQQ